VRFLDPGDFTGAFDCGEPSLDLYLRKRALNNHTQGAARCFVVGVDGVVAGYYTLSSYTVLHPGLPGKAKRNMPEPVPAVLLGRLAVDRKFQGAGLGLALLRDAVLRTALAAESVGVRLLVVHALSEQAAAWYRRHGAFEPMLDQANHLFLLVKDIREAMGPGASTD
jgi:ribosomal protein S18 acetylase RimI-like enzyme